MFLIVPAGELKTRLSTSGWQPHPPATFFLLVREWNVPDLLAFVLELLWDLAIKFLLGELLQWFQELWNGIAGKL
jgi:hypothetical protein